MKYTAKCLSILIVCNCFIMQEIQASTVRCKGKVVSLGDNRIDVLRKCGEPTFKYERQEERITRKFRKDDSIIKEDDNAIDRARTMRIDKELFGDGGEKHKGYLLVEEHRKSIGIEEWIYNTGPKHFLRTFIFRNGLLDSIAIGEYGFCKEESFPSAWGEGIVDTGDSMGEVLMKCGEPAFREQRYEEEILIDYTNIADDQISQTERRIFVNIEKWFYNLGPRRFMRILNFRNNRLVSVEMGERGYRQE